MDIVMKSIDEIHPYEKNPRKNDGAVDTLVNSIKEFGFKVPIVVDKNMIIIAGHTRWKAAKKMGMKEVPTIIASELSEAQVKAYRLADNKTSELSSWDDGLLLEEVESLIDDYDMELFGFDTEELKNKMKGSGDMDISPLKDDFIVPPFSILDTRAKDWQNRKNVWKKLGICGDDGRDSNLCFRLELKGASATSVFDPVLAEVLYHWFCPPNGTVIDPFAGGLPRGYVASVKGLHYTGMDLSERQIESNRSIYDQLPHGNGTATWIQGDSCTIDTIAKKESADFMLTCPPYFDLEKYSEDDGDLSNMSYDDFTKAYKDIIIKSASIVKNNRFAAIVMGDVRDHKTGCYHRLCDLTSDAMEEAGFGLYNEIILIETVGSRAYTARSNFAKRKVNKVHQNVMIFAKGKVEDIVKDLGELNDNWSEDVDELIEDD